MGTGVELGIGAGKTGTTRSLPVALLNPLQTENVGPWSTFYNHTCINELPVSPWSCCGMQYTL